MKKTFIYIAVICAAMFAGVSCEKIEQPQPQSPVDNSEIEEKEGTYSVTFECSMAEDDATRTEFHDNGIWWSVGDQVTLAQYAKVGGIYNYKGISITLKTSTQTLSHTTSSFNEPDKDTERDAAYFSCYPKDAYEGRNESNDVVYPRLTLPSVQKPSATQFDAASDILISEYKKGIEPDAEGKRTVKLSYTRPSAIGKMKISGLGSNENIASIKFSAIKSNKAVALAGSHYYDLVNGNVSKIGEGGGYVKDENEITLDYSDQEILANGMTAYFCCYPFELGEGDSFKLVITTTAGEVFTRTVAIPTGRNLKFDRGRATQFTVNMSSAEQDEATVTNGGTTTSHSTIAAAFDYANNATGAATITLMKDCTASEHLTVSNAEADITLNLREYTLTSSGTNRIGISSGKLTIIGEDNGKLTQNSTNSYTIGITGGELVLESGTVEVKNTATAQVINVNGGSLTVNGGNVINNGTSSSAVSLASGTATFESGSIISNGGPSLKFAEPSSANLTINGGFFKSGSNDIISGMSAGTIEIKGGYYSKEVADSYLQGQGHSCYRTNEYNDYPYAVLSTGVALFRAGTSKVESKPSIDDAITAANAATGKECTITLVNDCQVQGSSAVDVTNSAGVTLDLNGWTLTQNEKGRVGVASNGHLEITDNSKENTGVVQQLANSNITSYTISVSAGTLDITGGTIKQNTGEKGTFTVYVDGATLNVSGKANIEGDISIALYVESGTVIISNGTFSSKLYTIGCMGDDSTITIHDGVFKNTNTSPTQVYYGSNIYAVKGSVTIDGGQFTSNRQTVYCDGDNVQITISEEPSFKNNYNEAIQAQGAVVYAYGGKGNIKVNGGYFYTCCTNTSPLCFAGGSSAFDITRAILNTKYATNYVNSGSNTSTVELYHYHGSEYLKYTRETKPITSN